MQLKTISVTALPHSSYQPMGLSLHAYCVEDIYLRNLIPYKNNQIKKLNVTLVGQNDLDFFSSTTLSLDKFVNQLSIGEVFLMFDFELYSKSDEYSKKLAILDKIQEGFEIFCKQTNSDPGPFRTAYQRCINQKLIDEYVYKEVYSKDKKYKIQVLIRLDLTTLKVIGNFFDSRGAKLSERIFMERDPLPLYDEYLGDVKWKSDNEVILYGESKAQFWITTL